MWRERMTSQIISSGTVLAIMVGVCACEADDTATGAGVGRDGPAPIADGAVSPITQSAYPKTFDKWGEEGIARINKLLEPAARRVADDPGCDELAIIELSGQRSVPPDNIVLFADCSNGERYYLTEAQIQSGLSAVSKSAKTATISDDDAILGCEDEVKAKLQHPSSFDRDAFSTNVYRAPGGNIAVTFDFSVLNGIGNSLPNHARCVIDDTGFQPPEIAAR